VIKYAPRELVRAGLRIALRGRRVCVFCFQESRLVMSDRPAELMFFFIGADSKITGVYDPHWILGGFFLQAQEAEKGEAGEAHNLEIDSYDPVNKTLASDLYQSDGTRFSGTLTIAGNTITWAGRWVIAGKQYLFREPIVLAPDSMSGTAKGEISTDGKTWNPFFEAKFTKAKPGPKK